MGKPHVQTVRDAKTGELYLMYDLNVAGWLGSSSVFAVRYEDLVSHVAALDSAAAQEYFSRLFEACGINPVPGDWRERVKVGADRKRSGTARENLSGIRMVIPDELPDRHKRLVDYAVPGLRRLLGYEG